MRLLVAARLSQKGEHNNRIENDDKASIQWAQYNGHEIIKVVADFKSGTVQPWNRKNLKAWVTEPAKIVQYDGILASSFDRLSRGDKASTNEIENWARENGKVLLTIDGLMFPSEGNEGIRWDITARIAHQEWLNTSKRYKDIQAGLKAKGSLVGRPCYGFRIIEDDGIKTIAPNTETSPWVLKAIDRFLDSDDSLRKICNWLDSEDVKTQHGGKWSPSTLLQLLRNEALIGRRRDDRTGRTLLKFEGIITVEKWNKLQAKLDSRGKGKGIAPKQTASLTSVALCGCTGNDTHQHEGGLCGGPMYRIKAGSSILYYRCHGTDQEPSQCRMMIRLEELEAHVDLLFSPRYFGKEAVTELLITPGTDYTEEIAEIGADIRDLDLDDPDYDQKYSDLMTQRIALKALPVRAATSQLVDTGKRLHDVWSAQDDAERRSWLLAHGYKLYVSKPVHASWFEREDQDGTVRRFGPGKMGSVMVS